MFKKLAAKMGAGAASVDAVLSTPTVRPGEQVTGIVHVEGGDVEQEINRITVALETVVEVETDDSEFNSTQRFATQPITGGMTVRPNERRQFPFTLQVPYETPLTHIEGHQLPGVKMGVRTELEIARSVDKGDLDPVQIVSLPGQTQLMEALAQLGFRFKSADVEKGKLRGATLPFFQEIEFHPGPEYRGKFNELEVTFIGGPQETRVIFEADQKGTWFSEGNDAVSWFSIPSYGGGDFVGLVQQQLHALGRRRGWF
jgi:sporulation-control protein